MKCASRECDISIKIATQQSTLINKVGGGLSEENDRGLSSVTKHYLCVNADRCGYIAVWGQEVIVQVISTKQTITCMYTKTQSGNTSLRYIPCVSNALEKHFAQ